MLNNTRPNNSTKTRDHWIQRITIAAEIMWREVVARRTHTRRASQYLIIKPPLIRLLLTLLMYFQFLFNWFTFPVTPGKRVSE